ncbi:MAG: ferric iron uptake transcriptional regulator [Gammaproteobacteria bacterium]|nr:MAG: ferric iron uptake transcriptional regulator [Gammaproteobacteria bacterium]RLA20940.1 MAG: ferric iron uptake transcriptional regulator [Gammaproteobacteria bacterium]
MEMQDLREVGLKVTLPRVKILEMLEKSSLSRQHMSAEDVYKTLLESGEEIGLATVYRVLTQFELAGLVKRHHFEGGNSIFELNRGDHHDHILCEKCGRVDEFVSEEIELLQTQVAKRLGYDLRNHCLYLYGICPACQAVAS